MTEETQWLLNRAEESLKAAELMVTNQLYHSAVSEGYYSMFYLAQALILQKGSNASTHKGVLTQFSALYVKTGELDRSFSLMLANAFAARGKADYEIGVEILENEAAKVVMNAQEFLKMARSLIAREK